MLSLSTAFSDSRHDVVGSATASASGDSSSSTPSRASWDARYSSIGGNPTSCGRLRWNSSTSTNTPTTMAAPVKNAARHEPNTS